ncbi:hypothetical protein D3C80_1701600 [compost metagenome]
MKLVPPPEPTFTVDLVCRPSSAVALRLSALPSALNDRVKLSLAAGLPPTVVSTLKVRGLPLPSRIGLPAASSIGTATDSLLSVPGTTLPVPIWVPLASNSL